MKHSARFKEYVYEKMIKPQMSYSFNLAHGISYSLIGLCEMNIATRWNRLYWDCSCLAVNAGSNSGNFEDMDEEEIDTTTQVEAETEESEKKEKHVAPNYVKIAKAISDAQLAGVKIELPDINTAVDDFIPDIENNAILYSLSTVSSVSDDLYDRIVANRPYKSITDFCTKVEPTTTQMIGLIKAGCFDKLKTNVDRVVIMNKYLDMVADKEVPLKDKMTAVQLAKAVELGFDFGEYQDSIRLYHFKKYIDQHQYEKDNRRYILTDIDCKKFFKNFLMNSMNLIKGEYSYLGDDIIIKSAPFKRIYDKKMVDLMNFLNTQENREKFRALQKKRYIEDLKEKNCKGGVSAWEMETLSCYCSGHELNNIDEHQYNIKDFNLLPETIDPEDKTVVSVAGTVVGQNNTKHIVTILTKYGIVDVKLYTSDYTKYNQVISVVDPKTKKKTVLDQSWFKRGSKIIIYGRRRENMFVGKRTFVGRYPLLVGLIENVDNHTLNIRYRRRNKDEEEQ